MKKCKLSTSGKHKWVDTVAIAKVIDGKPHFTVASTNYIYCSRCGLVNDSGEEVEILNEVNSKVKERLKSLN